jgi:lyso-ornithine lipid O-acyltransferase
MVKTPLPWRWYCSVIGSVRAATRILAFVIVTLPLMPMQQLFIWRWPKMARVFPHYYHRMVCRILGITIDLVGTPPQGSSLIAANHVSWLDIVVLSAVAPCSFIAKREVGTWPLFGSLARLQRTVFVDRHKRHSTDRSRKGIAARLADGETLVLFAEGTSGDGASVRHFKSSFFAAASNDIRIVPTTLAYLSQWNMPLTRRQRPSIAWYGDMDMAPHLWGALKSGPIAVRVIFHEALDVSHRKQAAKEAEQTIRAGLASALHGPRDLL